MGTLAAYLQRALTNLTMKTFLCLAVLLAVAMEIRAQGNWNPCPSNGAADCAADPKMALAFCCAKHVGRLPWPVGAVCPECCVAEDICKEHNRDANLDTLHPQVINRGDKPADIAH